jgi:hypothetical protein
MRVCATPAIALSLFATSICPAQHRSTLRAVQGVVFDSMRNKPLRDALVMIEGRSTTTDARGRFHFDSVPEGLRTISVQHATLDTIGLFGISRKAAVNNVGADIRLGVPSFATLWHHGCGPSRPPADSGIVYGTVRDVRTRAPLAGVILEVSWIELALRDTKEDRSKEVVERRWRSEASSAANGTYAFCGVPPDATLALRARTDSSSSGVIELTTMGLRVHRQDLTVGSNASTKRGLVVGYLSDDTGNPFIDARITLDDSLEARSEFDGRFVFSNVATGSHQLVARYIGAAPVRTSIDIVPGDTTIVAMGMSKVTRLTTMNVTSPQRASMLREGYEARQLIYHRFMLDSSFIARLPTLANAFQTLPNVTVKRAGLTGFTVLVPDGHNGSCTPELRVDGVLINDFGQLLAIPPNRVVAMEVYPHASQVPPELQRGGIRYECGMVAVWTKWAFRIP